MTTLSLSRRALLLGSTGVLWSCRSPTRHHAATSATPRPAGSSLVQPSPRSTAVASPPTSSAYGPSAACRATDANIEGPFYKAGAPDRVRLVRAPDRLLVVRGRVLDDRCRPVPRAELDVWQADAAGAYDNAGFELRGRVRADDDGRYHFETVRPGHYLNGDRYRPAHIHVKIGAAGHRPLTTQLYFPDDPHNAGDPFLVPSLIMDVRASTIGELASFDFVLTRG